MLRHDIDAGRRFIEQQHLRLLSQRARDKDALLLPTRQLSQRTMLVIEHSNVRERLKRNVSIGFPWTLQQPKHAIPPHHDGFEHGNGKVPIDRALLREIANFRPVIALKLFTRAVENLQRAFQWPHESQDGLAERSLAGSVGANNPDELSTGYFQRQIFERNHAWKSEGSMLETNNRMRHAGMLKSPPTSFSVTVLFTYEAYAVGSAFPAVLNAFFGTPNFCF